MKQLALAVLSAAEEVGPAEAFSKAVQWARKVSAKALGPTMQSPEGCVLCSR